MKSIILALFIAFSGVAVLVATAATTQAGGDNKQKP